MEAEKVPRFERLKVGVGGIGGEKALCHGEGTLESELALSLARLQVFEAAPFPKERKCSFITVFCPDPMKAARCPSEHNKHY